MENYIFISYSTRNAAKCKKFKSLMENSGINCWMAPDSIEAGSDYARAIPKAIKNCSLFVVLLSGASQKSQWVPKEVDLAFKHEKPILPIMIEKCEIVEPFDFYLSNVQTVSLTTKNDKSVQRVVERVKAYLKLEAAFDGKQEGGVNSSLVMTDMGVMSVSEAACMHVDASVGRSPIKKYVAPSVELLPVFEPIGKIDESAADTAAMLERVINERFKTAAKVSQIIVPSYCFTRYEVEKLPYDVVKRASMLRDEIEYVLGIMGARIEPDIGRQSLYVDVPNRERKTLGLGEVIASVTSSKKPLNVAVGNDVYGRTELADLSEFNYIVAGQAGSGKSILLNSFIVSAIYKHSPSEVRLALIDLKRNEFVKYKGLPHLLFGEVIDDDRKALKALRFAVAETELRYELFAANKCMRISDYNAERKAPEERLPEILFIIDEFSYLMMSEQKKEIENLLVTLAGRARSAGIHIVLATQRPSVDVLTGMIKSNFTGRIAFRTSSQIDTRVIMDDSVGAEHLLCPGDMLYKDATMQKPVRVMGAYVGDKDINKIVEYFRP